MKALVTGAQGAFGSYFVKWLAKKPGYDVVCSSRAGSAGTGIVPCDLADPAAIRSMVLKVRPTHVFHLAASFSGALDRDIAINAMSAQILMESARELGLTSRVILAGSAAEYGLVTRADNPMTEDRVLRPVSTYGISKAMQTQLAGFHAHEFGTDVVVARIFNLSLPGLSERMFPGRIEQQIARLKRGEIDQIVVGNLENWRDYIDGQRCAEMLFDISTYGRRGEVYHVASGRPIQMRQLLKDMLTENGLDWSVVREQNAGNVKPGYDVPIIYADISKTRALSGKPR
jgi:nucleoside-diphosphate-sugar epimerase